MLRRDILTNFKVQIYQNINIQSIVLCISEQKLYRHLEGKAACYKIMSSAGHKKREKGGRRMLDIFIVFSFFPLCSVSGSGIRLIKQSF